MSTKVEILDLFDKTSSTLKFIKSEKMELLNYCEKEGLQLLILGL